MRLSLVVVLALQACGADCLTAPQAVSRVQFDDAIFGERRVQTFTLTNPCGDDVVVSGASATGDAGFEVDVTPSSVPGEGTAEVSVAFTGSTYGLAVADLVIETDHGPVGVTLTATADADQDGDGFDAIEAGGDDCDDADAERGAPVDETVNGEDDDCDGLVDEGFTESGDIVFTEIMLTPAAVTGAAGQWVEVRNETRVTKDLGGWTLSGPTGVYTIEPGVRINGGKSVVLGFEGDTALNGGVDVDGLLLGNTTALPTQGFNLTLSVDGLPIAVLSDYAWPESAGHSLSLDPTVTNPAIATRAASWCISTTALPSGDFATPGADNDLCPQFDHDGDGLSANQGDCDDTNDQVSPLGTEIWDGVDNNCDGVIDLILVPGGVAGQIQGNNDRLGQDVEVYDWDDDGTLDALLIASSNGGSSAYSVPAASLMTETLAAVNDVATGRFFESGGFGATGSITGVAPPFDADGDGDLDVVVLGRAPNFYQTGTRFDHLWVYDTLPTGELDKSDALIVLGDPLDGVGSDGVEALVDFDLDGDGTLDGVFGNGAWKGDVDNNDRINLGRVWILDMTEVSGRVDPNDLMVASWVGAVEHTYLGDAIAGGDVDDDGYDDVIVMDLDKDRQQTDRRVMLIPGGSDLPTDGVIDDVTPWTITGLGLIGGQYKDLQAPLHVDVDRDGAMDLVVPDGFVGAVRVFYTASDLAGEVAAADADLVITGPGGFGTDLAFGDIDGDGVDDLLVGAPTNSTSRNGRAYVFSGARLSGGGTLTDADAAVTLGSTGSADLGTRVGLADVDASGTWDIMLPDIGAGGFSGIFYLFQAPE